MILSSQGTLYLHRLSSIDLACSWAIPDGAAKHAALIKAHASIIDGGLTGWPSEIESFGYTTWLTIGSDNLDYLVGRSVGSTERDDIYGRGGNDTIDAGESNDGLWGEEGNDILYGGSGEDYLDGGNGDDRLDGGADDDFLTGWTGQDTLAGGLNDDQLYGCAGNDFLIGGQGADMLYGGLDATDGAEGMDTVSYATSAGGVYVNLVEGRGLNGDAEGDRIYGVENLVGSAFGDYLVGQDAANPWGTFFDASYYLNSNADLLAAFGAGNVMAATAHWITVGHTEGRYAMFVSGSQINAGGGNDIVYGGRKDDYLLAGTGGDTVSGQSGNDWIYGEAGDDRLEGGLGDDRLYGGNDDDTLIGGSGGDYLHGGAGFDTASYAQAEAGVTVNLAISGDNTGEATRDTYTDIEGIEGSAYADILIGNDSANMLIGGEGFDTLKGDIGTDALYGGGGNDNLRGGSDADILDGGEGSDTASYDYSDAAVIVNLATGSGMGGDAAGDVFISIENLGGSSHNDILIGSNGANTLDGGRGDDTLNGGLGPDLLKGGPGTDTVSYADAAARVTIHLTSGNGGGGATGDRYSSIENVEGSSFGDELAGDTGANSFYGLGGDDVLNGMDGSDILTGGAGKDAFVFTSELREGNVDQITDFTVGEDKIRLFWYVFQGLDVGPLAANAFVVGDAATQTEHRIIYNAATGALSFDADGSGAGAAIQFATLTANLPLTANDFLVI